jgi:hypothetical protein
LLPTAPTRSERRRFQALTTLNGVSVPMASAILMLLQPRRYGVIDIRVWQVLYAMRAVTKKSSGVGFNFNNWYQFLMITRYFAKELRVGARDVERSLFLAHQAYQRGTLYRPFEIARTSQSVSARGSRRVVAASSRLSTYQHAGCSAIKCIA